MITNSDNPHTSIRRKPGRPKKENVDPDILSDIHQSDCPEVPDNEKADKKLMTPPSRKHTMRVTPSKLMQGHVIGGAIEVLPTHKLPTQRAVMQRWRGHCNISQNTCRIIL